jgi:enoyl-CoA hydratase
MAHILLERTGRHAILTLNRPEKLNALSNVMKEDLIDLLEGLGKDDQLRVVVLTATGEQAFCTGTDIAELSEINSDQALKVSQRGQHLCTLVENFPIPVIAGVNGIAAGGGFELMLACHLRVASTSASFSLPETWLGLIPAYGGTQRLVREIGPGRAIEWMLTRRKISAAEAIESGLLNRVVPQEKLVEESMSLANEIEQLSPLSYAHV